MLRIAHCERCPPCYCRRK
jgi:hypothetical protein